MKSTKRETPQVKQLCEYMKFRAKQEGVKWLLPESYVQALFDLMIRDFFGVTLDDAGMLLSDVQHPKLLKQWRERQKKSPSMKASRKKPR